MDMQNVSNLQIPEGTVRTIHDKDNRLIWGRLAYGTKYAGDTLQNGTPTTDAPIPVQVVTGAQTVTIGDGASSQSYEINLGKNILNTSIVIGGWSATGTYIGNTARFNSLDKISVFANTTYTFSGIPKDATKTLQITIQTYDLEKNIITQLPSPSNWTTVPYTFTTPNNCAYITFSGRYTDDTKFGSLGQVTDAIQNVQIELGSTDTPYAPYFTPIELCKIGTYQDYIYKSGDDWYMHKEFGKYVFNGSETIAYNSSNKGFTINPTNLPNYMPNHATPPMVGLSTHFSVNSTTSTWTGDNRIGLSSTGTFWCKATSFANSKDDCLTWLSTNKPSIYYALATATNTQITDATLIGQLNAVHEWLTRYGYTSTVTGNLPIIIDRTNL